MPARRYSLLCLHCALAFLVVGGIATIAPILHYWIFGNKQVTIFALSVLGRLFFVSPFLLVLFIIPSIHAFLWCTRARENLQEMKQDKVAIDKAENARNFRYFVSGAFLTSSLAFYLYVFWSIFWADRVVSHISSQFAERGWPGSVYTILPGALVVQFAIIQLCAVFVFLIAALLARLVYITRWMQKILLAISVYLGVLAVSFGLCRFVLRVLA